MSALGEMLPPCSVLVQWRHRRRRIADVEFMWPSLLERASSAEEARVAWDVFRAGEGQEHWRCSCGRVVAELFRTLVVNVEP